MNTFHPFRVSDRVPRHRRLPGRSDPLEGPGPWIAFAIGLLLMLAAAIVRGEGSAPKSGGDDPSSTARRTERFTATVAPRTTIRVLNVSGDVVATAGREFSAVCNTTVTASTKARADEILGEVRTVQSRDGDELTLESEWPDTDHDGRPRARGGSGSRWSPSRGWQSRPSRCPDCKISMRYEVVVPPGVTAVLRTVIGDVSVQDLDGQLDVQSVNGNVVVRGSRRAVIARTVNGRVDVTASAAPAGTPLELKTVSGSVVLTLPKDAKFDVVANTMTGSIQSTFPLPVREARDDSGSDETRPPTVPAPPKAETPRAPRTPRRVVVDRDEDSTVVDVAELERELAESMREVERETRRMTIALPGGEYKGSIGQGGARVHLSTLSGRILLLAAGSKESDAKPLASRRSMVMAMPPTAIVPGVLVPAPRVHVEIPPVEGRVDPHLATPRAELADEDEDTVTRGDVAGDFLANSGNNSYRIGRVTGKVHILTHSGEIHVASAGSGAELKTYGGDIRVGPVTGDLKAQTLAGDIVAKAVSGAVVVETSGGDIRV